MELTEFLLARVAEDEAVARADLAVMERSSVVIQYDCETQARWNPARVLAQCEATRRIVETCGPYDTRGTVEFASDDAVSYRALRALASIWSDHDDYDPAWEV